MLYGANSEYLEPEWAVTPVTAETKLEREIRKSKYDATCSIPGGLHANQHLLLVILVSAGLGKVPETEPQGCHQADQHDSYVGVSRHASFLTASNAIAHAMSVLMAIRPSLLCLAHISTTQTVFEGS